MIFLCFTTFKPDGIGNTNIGTLGVLSQTKRFRKSTTLIYGVYFAPFLFLSYQRESFRHDFTSVKLALPK